MKVLFLDDVTYRMKYYVQALRQADIEVEVRGDLDEALIDFKNGIPWNGAIVDVMFDTPMPPRRYLKDDPSGQDIGPRIVRELRELQPGIKVIGFTAIPGRPGAQAMAAIPGVVLISKSTDPLTFRDRVLAYFRS